MAYYAIDLHDETTAAREARRFRFAHDDEAIDYAGSIDHAGEMTVWQGERLVARFPPVTRRWA